MTAAPSLPAFPFPTRFRFLLHLLVLLAVCTHADTVDNITPVILTVLSSVVSWLLRDSPNATARTQSAPPTAPPSSRPSDPLGGLLHWAPRVIPNVIVLTAAVKLALDVYNQFTVGTQSLIIALSSFLVVLAACKLYEPKTIRNIGQIIALSLLLVVASMMFSNSGISSFALLAGYLILLCYLALLLNLYMQTLPQGSAPVAPLPNPATTLPPAGPRKILLAAISRDMGNVARHCLFLAGLVSLLLFLTVPRSRGNPFLFSSWGVGPSVTGYSEMVQFQDYTTLSQSDAVVMSVSLTRNDQDVSSEFSDLYFRGGVLNDYDNVLRQWTRGSNGNSWDATGPQPAFISDTSVLARYSLASVTRGTLFTLSPSYGFNSEQCVYNYRDQIWRLAGGNRTRGPIVYSGYWDRNMQLPLEESLERLADTYQITPGLLRPAERGKVVMVTPEITAKARQILESTMGTDTPPAGKPIPPAMIHAVVNVFESYLRLNYRYSLTTRASDPNMDPTTDFLLHRGISGDNTGGHCEFFASALVMLCRSLGIYARMVQGYHGGELDVMQQQFIVREKYAHAWAEVYIPGEGWRLSDPSPIGSNLDTAAASGHLFKDLAQMFQSLWATMFVNFDNDSRAAIAEWFSKKFGALLDVTDFSTWTNLLLWVGVILLSFILYRLRQRFRRLRPLLEAARGKPHRQLRLSTHVTFLEELLHLFERGQWRRPDQTPLEFLEPHLAKLGPAASDVRWLVATAYAVRFGGVTLNPPLRQRIATALKNVKHTLKDGK